MLDKLDVNVAEAARLSRLGEWEQKARVHIEFHNLLAAATGNPVLMAMTRSMMQVIERIVTALGPTESDVVLRSRRRLMKHLRARDGEAAVAEMRKHLERMHKMWLDADYKGSRSASV
jgi:GntR family transcriptional regulator, transcriptional repressor for pyruvate dehydrogenase complex